MGTARPAEGQGHFGARRGGLWEIANDEVRLARLARRLGLAALALLVVFAAFYTYDRYLVVRPSLLDQSVRELEEAVRRLPDDATLRLQLGQAYERQRRYERAIGQYQQAIDLKESWQPATMAMARAELARGNEARAEELYLQVAEANRDNPMRHTYTELQSTYYWLGRLALKAGRHDEAAQWAEEALVGNRSDADALFLLGRAEEGRANATAAREAYRKAVALDPKFGEGFAALQRVAKALGDEREAAYASGMELLATGDAAAAVAALRELLQQAPDYGEAYQGLGLAYGTQGQREEAIKAFQAALERDPNLRLAQWSLRSVEKSR